MKKTIFVIFLLLFAFNCYSSEWIQVLQNNSFVNEELTLINSFLKSKNEKIDPCHWIFKSIELNYSPYYILKTVYSNGEHLDIDKICNCASLKGVSKPIIAKAVIDAELNGEKIYQLDEVTQSNCLKSDEGLPYTITNEPPEIIPGIILNPNVTSRSVP